MRESYPKLSVVMITYNHAKYIEQAVNSVLLQDTNFDYEIIIGEDCSTDRTREILIEFQKRHPEKIKLVLHPENVGMISNFTFVLNRARGQYIALIEGDDYWTSPNKLQQQVDYMEANPECRICFHEVEVRYEYQPRKTPRRKTYPVGHYQLEQVLKGGLMETTSVVFRSAIKPLPDWFGDLRASADWPLFVWLLLQGGRVDCMSETPMAVYRKHAGSITYILDNSKQKQTRLLKALHDVHVVRQYIPKTFKKYTLPRIFPLHLSLASLYTDQHECKQMRYHLFNYIRYGRFSAVRKAPTIIKLLTKCHAPHIYSILRNSRKRIAGNGTPK
jgi:glycosyltransferase involved in cell wall biosynthesis